MVVVLLAGGDIRKAQALARESSESFRVKTVTTARDPADHRETEEDVVAYLEAALAEGDPTPVAAALGDIARDKGTSQVARDAGLGRERL